MKAQPVLEAVRAVLEETRRPDPDPSVVRRLSARALAQWLVSGLEAGTLDHQVARAMTSVVDKIAELVRPLGGEKDDAATAAAWIRELAQQERLLERPTPDDDDPLPTLERIMAPQQAPTPRPGLKRRRKGSRPPHPDRAIAVALVRGGTPVATVARQYKVSAQSIRNWVAAE